MWEPPGTTGAGQCPGSPGAWSHVRPGENLEPKKPPGARNCLELLEPVGLGEMGAWVGRSPPGADWGTGALTKGYPGTLSHRSPRAAT